MLTILKSGSSGYVSGMLAWQLGILIGQSAAAWPIKMSSYHTTMPDTSPDDPDLSLKMDQVFCKIEMKEKMLLQRGFHHQFGHFNSVNELSSIKVAILNREGVV